ncbi:hypothetical protein O6H91_02G147500 [Diphasiastrum complanatum]|uniref:Uncharacterized protein n=1 Tax=Diphasiastrum complanatum TaxID=34168 RepID=A0ACC2ELP2_DIPCM|nr:hypothetical protein O6H91_02G147500 [Diphasiastrum complanatum]
MLHNSLSAVFPATTDDWSDIAVATLLDCYSSKYMELNRGSIRAKGWEEVISKLNTLCAEGKPIFTYRRCKNKLDVMKRRFKLENDKKLTNGGASSDWPWFAKMEEIMGGCPKYAGMPRAIESSDRVTCSLDRLHNTVSFHDLKPGVAASEIAARVIRVNSRNENQHLENDVTEAIHVADLTAPFCAEQEQGSIFSDAIGTDSKPSSLPGVSTTASRKRRKNHYSPGRQAKEIAHLVIEALERIELRRLEVMKEMEVRRHETYLQIAKMIIESNMQCNARFCNSRQESSAVDPQGPL